jgi:hypothetical protein
MDLRAMSYAIMPYKIRLDALGEVIALRDERLAAWAVDHLHDQLDRYEDLSESERPATEYLLDILLDRPEVEQDQHLYGYCVKELIELWGAPMANEGWWGMRYGWFDTVEAATGYDATRLVSGGPGVPCPAPEDFPLMGHVTRADLGRELDRLAAIDPARLTDPQVSTAVGQVRGWLTECRRDDMDLVCFYH